MESKPILSFQDVTTIMRLLDEIREDIGAIRQLLEEGNGQEEEDPEADG